MTLTFETPPPSVVHLLTGHYVENGRYGAWRARGADTWLLIATLGGAGRFGRGEGEFHTRSGDAVLIRPGIRHDYGTAPGAEHWDLLWAHFCPRPHWHEWLAWPEATPGVMRVALREPVIRQKIVSSLLETHLLATGALQQREAFAMNSLEGVLLWCGTQNPRVEPMRIDGRVRECLDFLCRDLTAKVSLDDLARRAELSVSRLAHLFRAQVGVTPQQFLEQQRLERARQLLELSGRSVGDIAADVGFDNPFYFTLRFKKLTGLSPRDYRKRLEESVRGG